MKKNDLIKTEDGIYRILSIEANRVLAIDCISKTMPKFYPVSSFGNGEFIDCMPADFPDMEDLSPADRKIAQERYTMIASAVSVVDDTQQRNLMIEKSSKQFGMSKQSIRSFLCSYLVYQDVAVLAPKQSKEKELTEDQKNMRWALNKFFYTRNQNSLPTAYAMMLKAKYCDAYGVLLPDYPSYNQFRYFYRKHRKMENYYISRDGIKDYQRNKRPLLGDGVQEFAPAIGIAMLDGTTCDIYLVNESGQLVGRPVLVVACDANTSLCLGYSLLWEGGTYSLQTLMLNILEDKVALCERMGIRIAPEQWAVNQLPAVMVTDGGSEYKGQTFEQIAELGVTLVNLPSYRPELKGTVEKLFDLVQNSYKDLLKGKGVIMPDFQERGSHDYRKDAVLTMQEFEKIVVRCIVHYNCERVHLLHPKHRILRFHLLVHPTALCHLLHKARKHRLRRLLDLVQMTVQPALRQQRCVCSLPVLLQVSEPQVAVLADWVMRLLRQFQVGIQHPVLRLVVGQIQSVHILFPPVCGFVFRFQSYCTRFLSFRQRCDFLSRSF